VKCYFVLTAYTILNGAVQCNQYIILLWFRITFARAQRSCAESKPDGNCILWKTLSRLPNPEIMGRRGAKRSSVARGRVEGNRIEYDNGNDSGEGQGVAKALFADVMEGSINTTVDPRQCIPLTRIRSVVTSGVKRLKASFCKIAGTGQNPYQFETGITAGSDAAILIPITGVYRKDLNDYFREEGLSEAEVQQKISSQENWYGVVDGAHRLAAILELVSENPSLWLAIQLKV